MSPTTAIQGRKIQTVVASPSNASPRPGHMAEQDRVFAKCAWRLIPFMALLFLVNFIDRTNVGFAALTMNRDLGFTPETFGFGAGAS